MLGMDHKIFKGVGNLFVHAIFFPHEDMQDFFSP